MRIQSGCALSTRSGGKLSSSRVTSPASRWSARCLKLSGVSNGIFFMSLPSRFQILIVDGIGPADEDISEAQWWFGAQPEGWEFL